MKRRRDRRDEQQSRENQREREVALPANRRELEERREEEQVEHRLQERLTPETHVEEDDRNVEKSGEIQRAIPEERHAPPAHAREKQRENAQVDEQNGELQGIAEEERDRGEKRETSQREEALLEKRDPVDGRGSRAHAARSGPRPAL